MDTVEYLKECEIDLDKNWDYIDPEWVYLLEKYKICRTIVNGGRIMYCPTVEFHIKLNKPSNIQLDNLKIQIIQTCGGAAGRKELQKLSGSNSDMFCRNGLAPLNGTCHEGCFCQGVGPSQQSSGPLVDGENGFIAEEPV